jgi:uncharacterized protein YdaU (DUF1376 family)
MPLYVADYLADTGHLSTIEHGAYLLLIMHYWQNNGLPNTPDKLARIARMKPSDWNKIEPTLAALFESDWHHKRIDFELAKASETISKRSAAGKTAASARYAKHLPIAEQSHTNDLRNAEQSQLPRARGLPSPSPSKEGSEAKASGADAPSGDPPDERTKLFRDGLQTLVTLTGRTQGQLRPLLGRWLKRADDDCRKLNRLIDDCRIDRQADPIAYIEASLKPKDMGRAAPDRSGRPEPASQTVLRSIARAVEKRAGISGRQADSDGQPEAQRERAPHDQGPYLDLEIPPVLRRN